ncbi:MAG: response regulator, partial [Acidobacteriota bacterium]
RRDAEVELTVRDDGPGIAPEHLERIFDRFYQVRDEHRVESVGTGLGLALSRQIVELHGGSLHAERVDGVGATFVVRLPIESLSDGDRLADRMVTMDRADDLPEPSYATYERPDPPVGTVTAKPETTEREQAATSDARRDGGPDERPIVLVVDDHPELRAYLRRHLEPTYRVVEAADGREALAEATSRTPDVVVTDIMMPELDGRALFRHLRDDPELELVPVILVTAVASAESRLDGLRDGVDDYLVKPFDPRELVARIDNLLASRRRLLDRAVPPSATVTVDATPMPSADQRFVDKVRRAVADRLDDSDLTVEALASAVGCDRSHLLRRLRTLTDQTPSALIRTMRL